MWVSLQKFSPEKEEWFAQWIRSEMPDWLRGICGGPWGPVADRLRAMIPDRYPIRDYPDITHNVICGNPVPWWDVAYTRTLGA